MQSGEHQTKWLQCNLIPQQVLLIQELQSPCPVTQQMQQFTTQQMEVTQPLLQIDTHQPQLPLQHRQPLKPTP